MKLKKFIATLAVVGMVAGMAVGCGSKEETAKADNGEKTESASDWDSSMDITIVSREDGSGTRGAFIELFGRKKTFTRVEKTSQPQPLRKDSWIL